MKKVVLTLAAVVITAIAAQAQSAGAEVRFADASLREAFVKKTVKTASTVRRNNLQRLDTAVQRQIAQQLPPQTNTRTVQPTVAARKTTQRNVKQWLKAIFLGGRFPGESAASYHNRLQAQSHPAALPFK